MGTSGIPKVTPFLLRARRSLSRVGNFVLTHKERIGTLSIQALGGVFGMPLVMMQVETDVAFAAQKSLTEALQNGKFAEKLVRKLRENPSKFFIEADYARDKSGDKSLPVELILLIAYYAERGYEAFSARDLARDFGIMDLAEVEKGFNYLAGFSGFFKKQGGCYAPQLNFLTPQDLFEAALNVPKDAMDYRKSHGKPKDEIDAKRRFKKASDIYTFTVEQKEKCKIVERLFVKNGFDFSDKNHFGKLSRLEERLLCNLLDAEIDVVLNEIIWAQYVRLWSAHKKFIKTIAKPRALKPTMLISVAEKISANMAITKGTEGLYSFMHLLAKCLPDVGVNRRLTRISTLKGISIEMATQLGNIFGEYFRELDSFDIRTLDMKNARFWFFGQEISSEDFEKRTNKFSKLLGSFKTVFLINNYSKFLPIYIAVINVVREIETRQGRNILASTVLAKALSASEQFEDVVSSRDKDIVWFHAGEYARDQETLEKKAKGEGGDLLFKLLTEIEKEIGRCKVQIPVFRTINSTNLDIYFESELAHYEVDGLIGRVLGVTGDGREDSILAHALGNFSPGSGKILPEINFFETTKNLFDQEMFKDKFLEFVRFNLMLVMCRLGRVPRSFWNRNYALFILPFLMDCLEKKNDVLEVNRGRFEQLPNLLVEIMGDFQQLFEEKFSPDEHNMECESRAVEYFERKPGIKTDDFGVYEVGEIRRERLFEIFVWQAIKLGLIGAQEMFNQLLEKYLLERPGYWNLDEEIISLPKTAEADIKLRILSHLDCVQFGESRGVILNQKHPYFSDLRKMIEALFPNEVLNKISDREAYFVKDREIQTKKRISLAQLFDDDTVEAIARVDVNPEAWQSDGSYLLDLSFPTTSLYQIPKELVPQKQGYFKIYKHKKRIYVLGEKNKLILEDAAGKMRLRREVEGLGKAMALNIIYYKNQVAIRSSDPKEIEVAKRMLGFYEQLSKDIFSRIFKGKHIIFTSKTQLVEINTNEILLNPSVKEIFEKDEEKININEKMDLYFALIRRLDDKGIESILSEGLFDRQIDRKLIPELVQGLDELGAFTKKSFFALEFMNEFIRVHGKRLTPTDLSKVWKTLLKAVNQDQVGIFFYEGSSSPIHTLPKGFRATGAGIVAASSVSIGADGQPILKFGQQATQLKDQGIPLVIILVKKRFKGREYFVSDCFSLSGERVKEDYLKAASRIGSLENSFGVDLDYMREMAPVKAIQEAKRIEKFLNTVSTACAKEFASVVVSRQNRPKLLEIILEHILLSAKKEHQLKIEIQIKLILEAVAMVQEMTGRIFEDSLDFFEYLKKVVAVGMKAVVEEGDLSGALFNWLEAIEQMPPEFFAKETVSEKELYNIAGYPNLSIADMSALFSYYRPKSKQSKRFSIVPEAEAAPPEMLKERAAAQIGKGKLMAELDRSLSIFSARNTAIEGVGLGIKSAFLDIINTFEGSLRAERAYSLLSMLFTLLYYMARAKQISKFVNIYDVKEIKGGRKYFRSRTKFDIEFKFRYQGEVYEVLLRTRDEETIGSEACIRLNVYKEGKGKALRDEEISLRLDYDRRSGKPHINIEIPELSELFGKVFKDSHHFLNYLPPELEDRNSWMKMVLNFKNNVMIPLLRNCGKRGE